VCTEPSVSIKSGTTRLSPRASDARLPAVLDSGISVDYFSFQFLVVCMLDEGVSFEDRAVDIQYKDPAAESAENKRAS